MSANDIRYGRRGGHEVDGGREFGNGRCIDCRQANPPGRFLYCSDECSESSRAKQAGKRGVAA